MATSTNHLVNWEINIQEHIVQYLDGTNETFFAKSNSDIFTMDQSSRATYGFRLQMGI
jgi:hypothetical protein